MKLVECASSFLSFFLDIRADKFASVNRITEVGSEVTGFEVGDSVLMSFGHCGDCKTCNEGHLSTCQSELFSCP